MVVLDSTNYDLGLFSIVLRGASCFECRRFTVDVEGSELHRLILIGAIAWRVDGIKTSSY